MKKLVSLILVLAMIAVFPISASAASAPGSSGTVYDSWDDDDWDDYDEWLMEIESALYEKMDNEYKGKLELPYWCWYDIDRDGVSELIVDNNEGKKGVEPFTCKVYNHMGTKPIITKGDFSVYYWDYEKEKAVSLKVSSNNMYLSVHPDGYLVASTVKGNTETYYIYGFYHYGTKMVAKTYTLTYKGNEMQTIKVKNPDGKSAPVDDEWFTCIELFNYLTKCTPLTFYQTS